METRTIDCVAFFYHKGAKGDDFVQKHKFRCCVEYDRFKSNADVNFYTGLPNYATLISILEFLNPGGDCENIRSRISSDVPEEFYNSESDDEENTPTTKTGHHQKLRPL